MKVNMFNIDKMIELNKLREVTNPILLERDNIPTSDGLLSYDIFGRTMEDRSTTFAYISLNGHFIHPLVYLNWKRINRKIEGVVSGQLYVSVDKQGQLVPDENGWTGLEELYKHYNELKFKPSESNTQNERIDFMKKMDRDEVFVSKWLVCPAYYRDIQLNKSDAGIVSVHEITDIYSKLIRLTNALSKDFSGLLIINNATRNKIQNILVSMYSDYFMKEIKGKNGLFRKSVLGKSVDYGCRLVISVADFNHDTPDEMRVDYEHVGLPLAATLTCFFPYIIKWLKDYFENNLFGIKDKFPVRRKDGTVDYVKLVNIEKYNDEYFTKAINSFIKSYADRFKVINLENDKGYDIKLNIIGNMATVDNNVDSSTDSTMIRRPATWTDLLYMAAHDVTRDKHILVTRYPLEDYFGIFPCKFNVLSTLETVPMKIGSKFYPYFPKVDPSLTPEKVASLFIDTLIMSNLYLGGLGADFDGDQITVRGIFDIHANKSCEELMYKKQNYLDISGNLKRKTEKEAIQTLYQLTSDI